jgi:hypothetical protein
MLKDKLFQVCDIKTEPANCPEWFEPGEAFIRVLSGRERERWEDSVTANKGKNIIRAGLVAACLCDGEGKPILSDKMDVERLADKSGIVLDRLFDQCRNLNRMDAADVEAASKNSDTTPAD